jgi:diguanylate cyclase (GGDEF)-like protein
VHPVTEKTRVLLVDADHRAAAKLSRLLWSGPYIVDSVSTVQGALVRVREYSPDVVVASTDSLASESLCAHVKRIARSTAVLLVYPSDTVQAEERAQAAGADGFLLHPYNAGMVLSCIRWVLKLGSMSRSLEELRVKEDQRTLAPAPGLGETARLEIEFFKRTLLVEVRRSKRYRYPLTLLAIGVDRFATTLGRLKVHVRSQRMGKLLEMIQQTLRDIDLVVHDGEQGFLVCLPQTDLDGARYVATRLHDLLSTACPSPAITVSVGLAAYDGSGEDVSFKELFDHACECLRAAQANGGDRVDVFAAAPTLAAQEPSTTR